MVALIDYGVGNLFSLESSFAVLGEKAVATSDPELISAADRIILPGVGAFGDAAQKLRESGLEREIMKAVSDGRPIMGICLGMQLLFERSYEFGCHEGLGLIHGEIRPISERIPKELKIPHIGWNALHFVGLPSPLFKYVSEGEHVYFVHSFSGTGCEDSTVAETEYGAPLVAAVARDNVYGCQFHPEKSGRVGLGILKAFCEL